MFELTESDSFIDDGQTEFFARPLVISVYTPHVNIVFQNYMLNIKRNSSANVLDKSGKSDHMSVSLLPKWSQVFLGPKLHNFFTFLTSLYLFKTLSHTQLMHFQLHICTLETIQQ